MATESIIKKLAIEQRRRLIATVLNAVDGESDPRLRREKIIAAINTNHDFMLDIIKVSDEEYVRNERALELIAQVHASQQRLERSTRAG